ncbi:MAG: hypothetical protein RL185_535 [Bacteroidota bacterium]|jgi:hypothetical protein
MKKSIQFTALLASLVILFFTACTKEVPTVAMAAPAKYIQEPIDTDESLEAFNNAMVRFDPLYLQVVFKEIKSKEQIQAASKELLIELNKNAADKITQKALTELYHFESFEALKIASDALTQNALVLKIRFFNNKEAPTTEQREAFYDARKRFIKNKLTLLEKANQKRATGLWNDMADEIERQFYYYTLVYNEEFESEMNGGGSECDESCCLEYVACQKNAKKDYIMNVVALSFMSGGYFYTVSNRLTINNPALNPMAPVVGAMIGLSGSILLADQFYKMDLSNCVLNYKACIQRKKGN